MSTFGFSWLYWTLTLGSAALGPLVAIGGIEAMAFWVGAGAEGVLF